MSRPLKKEELIKNAKTFFFANLNKFGTKINVTF